MVNKELKFAMRIISVILGISALFFQFINLLLGTMVKSSLDVQSEWFYYLTEFIPHLSTIIIIIWFLIFQIKMMIKRK